MTTVTLDLLVVNQTAGDADALRLSNVASTGSRLGLSVKDTPASVFVIDQSAFERHGYADSIQAINSVVGFNGANTPGEGAIFSTRGLSGYNIVQRYDGVYVSNPAMSVRVFDSFNLASIEVIKGSSSVLFGEGAVGATINYISKEPSSAFAGNALVSYGTYNSVRAGVGLGGPIANSGFSYRVDATEQSSNRWYSHGDDPTGSGC